MGITEYCSRIARKKFRMVQIKKKATQFNILNSLFYVKTSIINLFFCPNTSVKI